MGKMGNYQYYVEGQNEEKLISVLKTEMELVCPGKIDVLNVVQEELTTVRLMQLKPQTTVILVFDTDVGNIDILKKNIDKLDKCSQVRQIWCITQVENIEDELVRSCNIKTVTQLTGSRSGKDFKRDFITLKNLKSKLEQFDFDIEKIWSCSPKNQYKEIKNDASKIKKGKKKS